MPEMKPGDVVVKSVLCGRSDGSTFVVQLPDDVKVITTFEDPPESLCALLMSRRPMSSCIARFQSGSCASRRGIVDAMSDQERVVTWCECIDPDFQWKQTPMGWFRVCTVCGGDAC